MTVGELLIVGDNVSRGYFGKPELTTEKFTTFKGKPAYRTGDHGYYKGDLLFFIGRIDNQIKLHGFRIEIDEIDSHIMDVPCAELSVTVPLIRDGDVKRLVAFIKLRNGFNEAQAQALIRAHLEKKVPYYMIPGVFKFVVEFPYSASHKIDKKQLLASL
jgi:D-alanine--poly(phosphoribitol) ligase subunit 1